MPSTVFVGNTIHDLPARFWWIILLQKGNRFRGLTISFVVVLQLIVIQEPFVNVFGVTLQNLAATWLKPLPLVASLRGDGIEIKTQRRMVPPTPTAHACAPRDLVQELVHVANVPKAVLIVEPHVGRRHHRWAVFWKPTLRIIFFFPLHPPSPT